MPTAPRTIKRKPVEGDIVLTRAEGDKLWLVTQVNKDVWYRRITRIDAISAATGLVNAFSENEVAVVCAADASHIKASVLQQDEAGR